MSEELKWKARFERERLARKEAEKLLEEKSAELYELNVSLQEKVQIETETNRRKEMTIMQQSKMASIGEMIGNIAHQWRQPLSAISSLASSHILHSQLGTIDTKESIKILEDIMDHTQFLSNTIEDFRNYFKNDKEFTYFLVSESIERCLKIVSGVLSSNSIEVIKKIDDIKIFSLKNEFIQVILNILKNAIDAMENVLEDDQKYIMIKVYKEDQNAIIEIKDSAGGIPESIINKIFEPYFTTKHQSQGTGIGLFMSNEIIVKHMKGKLEVCNEMTPFDDTHKLYGAFFKIAIPLEV